MDYKWTDHEKKVVDGLQFELDYAEQHNLVSAKVIRGMLKDGIKLIEDQQERIAIMSEGDTEAMLNKACETMADFDLDFVCDDNTLDDGWCSEHCNAVEQKPECFMHWLLKRTSE